MRIAPDMARGTSPVPGPELPAVKPPNPALPWPAPSLDGLYALAVAADPAMRLPADTPPGGLINAHYSNTRTQLAYALTHPYSSVEGDVRMRDGVPVMQHDADSERDLTFEQWATIAHRAGRHLRIDLKERDALAPVEAIVRRLGIDDGMVTWNVGVGSPWSQSNQSIDTVRALKARHPRSWFSINLALPTGPGVIEHALILAHRIGGDRLGTTVLGGAVTEHQVKRLRGAFEFLNAWNIPFIGHLDIAREAARLRAIGVNGMIDLRSSDDPLADDD